MSLSWKLFTGYAVFVFICGYFVTNTIVSEIKPPIRQSTEETLVDTANLLAELLAEPVKHGHFDKQYWGRVFRQYGARKVNADIWGNKKGSANHRIYVTDRFGIVLLDSGGIAIGEDYSNWRDVYLTLRGKYGARTTKDDPNDERSSVMHVAAPIKEGAKIIGVVTVAKPNRTVLPYIQRAQARLTAIMAAIVIVGILIGGLLAWWFGRDLQRLQSYARSVSSGQRIGLNTQSFPAGEMRDLAGALTSMREELEGKTYVENYVQSLTHELKSPLAGIKAATEILHQPLNEAQRIQFLGNVEIETERLSRLVERVLELARLEQRSAIDTFERIDLNTLVAQRLTQLKVRALKYDLQLINALPKSCHISGDTFLIDLALSNLLENALEHTLHNGIICIYIDSKTNAVCLYNQGLPIPDYALHQLTNRFYSLPRPNATKKSSGLGLNFVAEIAALHQGEFSIRNTLSAPRELTITANKNNMGGVIAEIHLAHLHS